MAIARSKLVDMSVARWYHCVSRCVRKAFLLGEGDGNRKEWLENRLEELGQIFAVALGGFSLMDNHLHVLLRLDPAVAGTWSDDEVVRRWGRLFPPRDKFRQPIPLPEQWIKERLDDAQWKSSTAIVWWAASSRPAARNSGKSPNVSVCGVWSTWSDVQFDESILNRGSHRTELSPVDRPARAA
jgi:hypothetical protein